MMQNIRITLLVAIATIFSMIDANAQISISQARTMPLGSTVTVRGIITSGSEFGTVRYMQDSTAGIAIYDFPFAGSAVRGQEYTVTGELKDFNGLLEIDPVTSSTLHSSNNPMPAEQVIATNQLSETYEGEIIRMNNVTFIGGGGTFAGNTTYNVTDGTNQAQLFVRNGNPLVGQLIPTASLDLIGICSQYQANYQALPRDINDLIVSSSVLFTSQLSADNITTTSLDVEWTTNINGDSYIEYGKTPALELGTVMGSSGTSNHVASITGAMPSDIFYVKGYTVAGTDTAVSGVRLFATASLSSGDMKIYFNHPVNTGAASSVANEAMVLNNLIDDTLIAYLDRAQSTIDFAIYNFDNNNISNISAALNNAHNRGVRVRIVADMTSASNGLNNVDPAIGRILSPSGASYGIMHNKFVVIDAESSDPEDAIVIGGSTNWTDNQINSDYNHITVITDQTLAKVYVMEFEEMFGSNGAQPNSGNAKFGPDKEDNTPHQFVIGGIQVENYFSPSDQMNQVLIESIRSAQDELFIFTMLITRSDLAFEIGDASSNGADVYVVVDNQANTLVWNTLQNNLPMGHLEDLASNKIMHHKCLIADPNNPASDPLVVTGSHNWSNSADQRNDENSLVIHDEDIVNQFYQAFLWVYNAAGGVVGINEEDPNIDQYKIYPVPNNGDFTIEMELAAATKGSVLIRDLSGRIVDSSDFGGQEGQIQIQRSLDLVQGVYFVTIVTEDSQVTEKMIVR